MVEEGAGNAEILRAYPSAMNHLPRIDQARQTFLAERYRKTFRELSVTYIWGRTGVGKTRSVMEEYGYENVYRVTNYRIPLTATTVSQSFCLTNFAAACQYRTC